jgi:hypothetical protein
MGLHVSGMSEWQRVLETLPERAPKAFRDVVKRGGVQIRIDWQRRWREISTVGHIPHLIRNVGFDDVDEDGSTFSVKVGVQSGRKQSRLASFITYGTLTSGPHDAGLAALEVEAPKTALWAGKVAAELLEEAKEVDL